MTDPERPDADQIGDKTGDDSELSLADPARDQHEGSGQVDPRDTAHPTGEQQAKENTQNESAG